MKIKLTDEAVEWFKNELDLPEENKVLQFYVRYGGEFQLKQGFSPAFRVELSNDVEIGDHEVLVEKVDHEDEIVYSTTN